MKYRADIDGLRALAVLSVIIFHIDESLLPGGFIGVDVFFVISGYLISLKIMHDLAEQKFSFAEFYRRRIKRIIPVLLFIIIIGLVGSQILFIPEDAIETAYSALWAILSVANVYFWLTEDHSYFAPSSEEIPFLHLWSLGVEEQFYLIWPLLLFFLIKNGSSRLFFIVTGGITVLSFAGAHLAFDLSPSFMYYMLPSRMGELLMGAIAGYLVFHHHDRFRPLKPKGAEFLALLSLIVLIASFFLITKDQVFPGLFAVPPTLSTALIIFSGNWNKSSVATMLSSRLLVFIGKLSYSAYLWHWLILAFYRYFQPVLSLTDGIIIFVVTFLLSYLTYRFIEIPFRHSENDFQSVLTNQYLIPAMVIMGVIIFSIDSTGYGFRQDRETFLNPYKNDKMYLKGSWYYDYVCMNHVINDDILRKNECVLGDVESDSLSKSVLYWGDSNAAHFIGILGVLGEKGGFAFRNLSIGGCPPILTNADTFVDIIRREDCELSRKNIAKAVSEHEILIISANWPSYISRDDTFLEVFTDFIDSLKQQQKKVILIGKTQTLHDYDPLCDRKALRVPWLDCSKQQYPLTDRTIQINDQLKAYADRKDHVTYYDFNDYICPNRSCNLYDEMGARVYFDRLHINIEASWKIGYRLISNEGVPHPFSEVREWVLKNG